MENPALQDCLNFYIEKNLVLFGVPVIPIVTDMIERKGDIIFENETYTLRGPIGEVGCRKIAYAVIRKNGKIWTQPFYQSSGYNSGAPGTFLPFQLWAPSGWFRKAWWNGESESWIEDDTPTARLGDETTTEISNLFAEHWTSKQPKFVSPFLQ